VDKSTSPTTTVLLGIEFHLAFLANSKIHWQSCLCCGQYQISANQKNLTVSTLKSPDFPEYGTVKAWCQWYGTISFQHIVMSRTEAAHDLQYVARTAHCCQVFWNVSGTRLECRGAHTMWLRQFMWKGELWKIFADVEAWSRGCDPPIGLTSQVI